MSKWSQGRKAGKRHVEWEKSVFCCSGTNADTCSITFARYACLHLACTLQVQAEAT